MAIRRFIRDDYRYVIFAELYDSSNSPQRNHRAQRIVESAIKVYARSGLMESSLNQIAIESGCSLSTLKNYFKSSNELRFFTLKYVRVLYQEYVIHEMSKGADPKEALEIYLDCCLRWPRYFIAHQKVWLSFLSFAAGDSKLREMNQEAVRVGFERLKDLIQKGVQHGQFNLKTRSADQCARVIHTLVTGVILSQATENSNFADDGYLDLKAFVFEIIGAADNSPRNYQQP